MTAGCGRLDILVNCANVEPHYPLLELDEWDWQRTLGVNLTGAFLLMQSAGRVMREAGSGVIVNVAPMVGLVGLTRQAAAELAPHGIRVYGVVTGLPELASEQEAHADIATAVLSLSRGEAPAGNIVNIM